ncbi:Probable chromosome-partitioning protein parB [Anaerobiospirillum thomasii]|uniref:Probable chromosome-partitioning protein ParB n=1 Tax=Anaerobiospirillum thomasii TaxID=179995 RepID=A0A2X0WUN8_9GAMM|nr:ParB/RepB/Spo0J family partition protein [Anaerobiospirillum thomasii]SPT69161.1 Probable chromosome-partitioning protein parB [Anaerobiospirillum thomasii]SPT72286.1 Probable chromosome-partitioning protein parB [Anaerobiospirillum thomasii]
MTTKRLGRGLDSLLSKKIENRDVNSISDLISLGAAEQEEVATNSSTLSENTAISTNSVLDIDIDKLKASKYQPRKNFDTNALEELAESIKEHGLLEPLLVKKADDGMFEIICGERRFRASKIASLKTVPCLVKDDLKNNAYAIALIENMQREDLNPLEQAEALSIMLTECELTQESLAKTLGKSRSTISNILRLNSLAPKTKDALREGVIDMGHAKALLSLEGEVQERACEIVIQKSMSVRQTEIFVKSVGSKEGDAPSDDNKNQKPDVSDTILGFESILKNKLDAKNVKFSYLGKNKGKITLTYKNEDEFNRIKEIFSI